MQLDALAEKAIRNFELAKVTHSEAVDRLVMLQSERPGQKITALAALCAQTHPVSGKPYSVSQAEDVLQLDPAYAAYKARVADAEAGVREAEDEKVAARLVAELRVNQACHPLGVA